MGQQSEKTVYDLKKELEEKQLLLLGMHAEKVYVVNEATKVQDELDELKDDYGHLWSETKRLYLV